MALLGRRRGVLGAAAARFRGDGSLQKSLQQQRGQKRLSGSPRGALLAAARGTSGSRSAQRLVGGDVCSDSFIGSGRVPVLSLPVLAASAAAARTHRTRHELCAQAARVTSGDSV